MVAYASNPIVDPDSLSYLAVTDVVTNWATYTAGTDELIIDYINKKIALVVVGTQNEDGTTIKCVYSKLKEIWRTDTTLIKFPFPMGPITDEQFEMINGWNWEKTLTSGTASQTTIDLLRTGGWSVVNTSSAVTEMWTSVITLGAFAASTDQAYYQQVLGGAATNFKLTNNVNQAVQVYSDPTGASVVYDYRTYLKVFLREYAKLYSQSANTEIGAPVLTYQSYRFPLSNSTDLKVTHLDTAVGGGTISAGSWAAGSATITTSSAHGLVVGDSVTIAGATPAGYNGTFTVATAVDSTHFTYVVADPTGALTVMGTYVNTLYSRINITYLRDANDAIYTVLGNYNPSSFAYVIGNVVKDTGNNRWYECILGYTSSATLPSANATNWVAYTGERAIGATYYPFTVIVDADTTVGPSGSGAAVRAQVYEKIQWSLRQNTDIDADAVGSITGKTADLLLQFVGDTLVTKQGVYIDSFNSNDINDIEYYDSLNTKATFPYVASITLNFGDNLKNDASAKYWLFFTTLPGGSDDFGQSGALLVKNDALVDITGTVSAASSVSWTFDYDFNVQGGRTQATPADVTAVALGLQTGQYVKATGTIARSKANSVSLVAALERNYNNPA